MSAARTADLGLVASERGKTIGERFDALEITDREWYRKTGIDRKTLNRAIEGLPSVRTNTYRQIEDWLARLEGEKASFDGAALPDQEPRVVTFTVSGNFGVDVVVSGPVDNIDDLRETVEKLMRGMGEK